MAKEKGLPKERLHARRLAEFEARRERKGEEWAEAHRLADAQTRKDEASGRKQREAGQSSPGRRGNTKTPRIALRAAVMEMHRLRQDLSYSTVCLRVGKAHGYSSGWSAEAATSDLKWPDPSRRLR